MQGIRPPDGLLQERRDDQAILSRENGSGVSQITEGGFKRIEIHQAIVSILCLLDFLLLAGALVTLNSRKLSSRKI